MFEIDTNIWVGWTLTLQSWWNRLQLLDVRKPLTTRYDRETPLPQIVKRQNSSGKVRGTVKLGLFEASLVRRSKVNWTLLMLKSYLKGSLIIEA